LNGDRFAAAVFLSRLIASHRRDFILSAFSTLCKRDASQHQGRLQCEAGIGLTRL